MMPSDTEICVAVSPKQCDQCVIGHFCWHEMIHTGGVHAHHKNTESALKEWHGSVFLEWSPCWLQTHKAQSMQEATIKMQNSSTHDHNNKCTEQPICHDISAMADIESSWHEEMMRRKWQ